MKLFAKLPLHKLLSHKSQLHNSRSARQRETEQPQQHDPRVFLHLKDLLALRSQAIGFSAVPRTVRNQFIGRHPSSQRGRGLNFEQLSHYRIGDDTRLMDWKVTNRTRKPHVRVYNEEREKPIMLVCDQSDSMFFGSEDKMKSVVAAEIMALLAWRHLALGDSIASLMFNDSKMLESDPHRSTGLIIDLLQRLATMNRALGDLPEQVKLGQNHKGVSLNEVLTPLSRLCSRGYVIVIISDFLDLNTQSTSLIKSLALNNDVILASVNDAAEKKLPAHKQLIIGKGMHQLAVDTSAPELAKRYLEDSKQRDQDLKQFCKKNSLSLCQFNTVEPSHQQLRRLLPESTAALANKRHQVGAQGATDMRNASS